MTSSLQEQATQLLAHYDFNLPVELIAQRPMNPRAESRLLVYNKKEDKVTLSSFSKLAEFLPPSSTLIFNQSKVYPARLMGQKTSGGKGEIFVLSLEKTVHEQTITFPCLLGFSGKKMVGQEFLLEQDFKAKIMAIKEDGIFLLSFSQDLKFILNAIGKVPIPPYIRNGLSDDQDLLDYQTVYAKHLGSVAAPTAGLHFDREFIEELKSHHINTAHVCLHVGMGTFAPVKCSNIEDHKMHAEEFFIEADEWQKIKTAKTKIAVGTTSLRTLESIVKFHHGEIDADRLYSTDIFLRPGQEIHSIKGLITNFHLPKSSLLMLVSALIGRDKLMELYELAIKEKFRFYSYGDAMCLIL